MLTKLATAATAAVLLVGACDDADPRVAHRSYFDLVREYDRHGSNRTVDRITKRQLNRAANAMADLLTSIR